MLILRHDPVAFMVTVIPLLIVMSSLAVGTAAPPQVVVLFQLPLTLAVRAAAIATEPDSNSIANSNVNCQSIRFARLIKWVTNCGVPKLVTPENICIQILLSSVIAEGKLAVFIC